MSPAILLPLLYLFIGLVLGKNYPDTKRPAAALLTKVVIPLVIIYNLATYRPGFLAIMLGVLTIMGIMALLGQCFTKDPIRNLCFFYSNIGWLGLPVATALFGDHAAAVFIAAYIGSTAFGNSIGAGMLEHGTQIKARMWNLLKSPPLIASLIGIALMPLGDAIELYLHSVYGVLKFLLGFTGMAILGIWLAESRIQASDIRNELRPYLYKSLTSFALVTVFIQICSYFDIALVTQNTAALYLICLLPPAANIVVLETHYRRTGHSAKLIASGTCISIAAIFLYACLVPYLPLTR